jgi:hypothetical protein
MYGKIMSRLITVFWILQVIAVIALGAASLVAIDGKGIAYFQPLSLTLPILVTPYILENIRMCNLTYVPRFASLFWVPMIVFETFLFSLALRMAYRNYQDIRRWPGVSLIHVILRDNFIFFVWYVYCKTQV